MFVGHAALAFALAALAVNRYGPDRRVALPRGAGAIPFAVAVGLVAGLFASLPDVDVAHAAVDALAAPGSGTLYDQFWSATTARHRLSTHSLVIGLATSGAAGLWVARRRAGAAAFGVIVLVTAATEGVAGGAVMVLFVAGAAAIATTAATGGLSARTVAGAGAVGLAVHPFTDLLTGTPPAFLAPLDVALLGGRVEPFADATLNLLVAFGAELAVIWLGLLVGLGLVGIEPRQHVHAAALLGLAYGPMALVLDRPSVDHATPFVATILPVGLVGVVGWARRPTPARIVAVGLTALTAISAAWLAFGVSYLLVG